MIDVIPVPGEPSHSSHVTCSLLADVSLRFLVSPFRDRGLRPVTPDGIQVATCQSRRTHWMVRAEAIEHDVWVLCMRHKSFWPPHNELVLTKTYFVPSHKMTSDDVCHDHPIAEKEKMRKMIVLMASIWCDNF
jgi:hypothetical protein